METDKYKLAFKKIFDQKKAKDKYQGKEQDAAKKALEKVKRMKGAANYNMFVYNNKGEVKGIKIFLKKDKKKPEDEKGVDVLTPPTPTVPARNVARIQPRPKKEEQKEKDKTKEELLFEFLLKKYMKQVDDDDDSEKEEEEKKEEEEEEEETSYTESNFDHHYEKFEQRLKKEEINKKAPKTPKAPKAPKAPRTPKPATEEVEPLHGTQGPAPMTTPKPMSPPEPLEAPPAPKISSKSAPSLSTPTATPKAPRVKQVAPKPPRKIPQGLTQKYETASVTFDLSVASPTTPTAKRVKDYRNNPEDRRNAYTKMCMCM